MPQVHSIYGRLFGIRNSNGVPYLSDPTDGPVASDTIGASVLNSVTSTGATLKNYGINVLAPSSAATHFMPTPSGSGRKVWIVSNSASTSCNVAMSSASGAFQTTSGTSMHNILFKGRGAAVELIDISTIWQVAGIRGTTDTVIVTS